jgi:hypothetical protein
MSNVSNTLRSQAKVLRTTPEQVAIETLVKQAGMTEEEAIYAIAQDLMEKEAAAELGRKGFDVEEAAKMVKAAKINVKELANFKIQKPDMTMADVLEKAAAYIDSLEQNISELESETVQLATDLGKMAADLKSMPEPEVKLPKPLEKMAGVLTLQEIEDIKAWEAMNPHLLDKIAIATDEPWGLGKPTGKPGAEPMDPLTAWLSS